MPRQWSREWAYKKSQLVQSLFEKKNETFSPIEQEHELSPSAIAEPTSRSLSPLPDLIVEREEDPHDESKEFYEGFEARILRLYRIIFNLEESDDNLSVEEIDKDGIEETYINSYHLADDERPEDLVSVYCICDSDDGDADQISEGGISEHRIYADLLNDVIANEDQISDDSINGDYHNNDVNGDQTSENGHSEDQINNDYLNDAMVNDQISEDPVTNDYRNEVYLDEASEDSNSEAVISEDQVNSDQLNDVEVNREDLSEEGIDRERIKEERISGLEISEGLFGEHRNTSGHEGFIDRQAGTFLGGSAKKHTIQVEELRRATFVPAAHSSLQSNQYFSDDSSLLQTSAQKRAAALSSASDEMELDTDSFLLNEAQVNIRLSTNLSSCSDALSRKRSSSLISEEPSPKRMYMDVGVQTVVPQAIEWENLMSDFFRGRSKLYRCLL